MKSCITVSLQFKTKTKQKYGFIDTFGQHLRIIQWSGKCVLNRMPLSLGVFHFSQWDAHNPQIRLLGDLLVMTLGMVALPQTCR